MSMGRPDKRDEYLLTNFERAIQEGWIELYSQAVIRSSNGKVCGEEMFARWHDPVYGILNPGDYLPILERFGKIERLDLYVLEKSLEKTRKQMDIGIIMPMTAVNLSLSDFRKEGFAEKIEEIVSASGIPRERLALEIPESPEIVENRVINAQLEKLCNLGYRLAIDDFGCHCVTLFAASQIHFYSFKINMSLIQQIPDNYQATIIVEELIKTAGKLGIRAIAKGVEKKEQADALMKFGCSIFQGYYYSAPVSTKELLKFALNDQQFLSVEDPEEENYFFEVDKINLHELFLTGERAGTIQANQGELPISILEISMAEDYLTVIRCNDSLRRFIHENFPGNEGITKVTLNSQKDTPGSYTLTAIKRCLDSEDPVIIDDRTPAGRTVHLMVQRVAHNQSRNCWAILFVVIAVDDTSKKIDTLSYNHIARALSEDYIAMYVVDMETNNYVEYHNDGINRDVTIEYRGEDFFYDARNDKEQKTYKEDRKMFSRLCTKENIQKQIRNHGAFSITYRANDELGIRYVNFKAVADRTNERYIIIGVTSVDNQMKQQEAFKALQKERTVISRIAALAGNFFAIYTIDISDNSYTVNKTNQGKGYIGENEGGEDFFYETQKKIKEVIYPDDLSDFIENIRKEKILQIIKEDGAFEYQYRLVVDGKPTYFKQKGVVITENEEQKLIIGLINIDDQIRKDREYAKQLSAVEARALKDELTGVKNKYAYAKAKEKLEESLKNGEIQEFAIVVLDLNDLKYVNDTLGHKCGDAYIRKGCKMICDTFSHSPVFRIGGDEFVVIICGEDYDNLDLLMGILETKNNENKLRGEVTLAAGRALGKAGSSINEVFEQADAKMYENKKKMKSGWVR